MLGLGSSSSIFYNAETIKASKKPESKIGTGSLNVLMTLRLSGGNSALLCRRMPASPYAAWVGQVLIARVF